MNQFIAMLEYCAKRKQYTPNQIAIFMKTNVSTFYIRKRNPASFRLSELLQLAQKLDMQIIISSDGTIQAKEAV